MQKLFLKVHLKTSQRRDAETLRYQKGEEKQNQKLHFALLDAPLGLSLSALRDFEFPNSLHSILRSGAVDKFPTYYNQDIANRIGVL